MERYLNYQWFKIWILRGQSDDLGPSNALIVWASWCISWCAWLTCWGVGATAGIQDTGIALHLHKLNKDMSEDETCGLWSIVLGHI